MVPCLVFKERECFCGGSCVFFGIGLDNGITYSERNDDWKK